ncbi:MAG: MMOB1630 family gliding motility ATPase complex subunit [Metamycoplasmataceae bacterium]
MNTKELKEKQNNLSFFLKYVDVSKIIVLKNINEENRKLKNIQYLKTTNFNFLKKANNKWPDLNIFDKMKKGEQPKKLYFLIDPEKIDDISVIMLKKLQELISKNITKNDYVVTFGNHSNLMAQKLELNVIEKFPLEYYSNLDHFSDLTASIIDLGTKNNIFNQVEIILSNIEFSQNELIKRVLFPLDHEKIDMVEFDEKKFEDEEMTGSLDNNDVFNFIKIYKNIDITKIIWEPNITFFVSQMKNIIIKQIINEAKTKAKIEQLRLEFKLLEEKKNKLLEKQELLIRNFNRIRKEESTIQSLLLHSAFKVSEKEPMPPLMNIKDNKGGS